MKKIFVLNGHPCNTSFCNALAKSYIKGAKKSGAKIRFTNLGDLKFNPSLSKGYKKIQKLEPDLVKIQKDIKWADHIVLTYPIWWNSMPALLKGMFDRMWLPGFGFSFNKVYWQTKLLKGRSARLIITMDSPWIIHHFWYGGVGERIIKRAIFKFSGINPVKITHVDFMKIMTERKAKKWLALAEKLGTKQK